jgi:hypothetical protein
MKYMGGGYMDIRKKMQQENGKNCINEKLHILYPSPDVIRVITTTRMGQL